ncbi:MAG TPA: hypothetical protein VEA37_04795 [Flavobacterium sp.]|nr:hypothetical protein [Flavobacterium sp.]
MILSNSINIYDPSSQGVRHKSDCHSCDNNHGRDGDVDGDGAHGSLCDDHDGSGLVLRCNLPGGL